MNQSNDNHMYLEGLDYRSGKLVHIGIRDGKIAEVIQLPEGKGKHPFIAPGLVDLQVNGYGGVDFNTAPLLASDVYRAVQLLAEQGVTTFFPTLITNTPEAISEALKVIISACHAYPEVNDAIGGIHLEGPFLSKEEGARGAHDPELVRKPDWDLFLRWQEAAEGRIKIITLSPEWEGSEEFITRCSESGVVVSVGHTAATPEQIAGAVAAGARLSTHLGNAAHLMLPRHPNYIWEQLAQDTLWTTVIGDGFHLPESFLKVVFKVKPENSILISDCTHFAGLPPGNYHSHIGGDVILSPEGRLCMADQPKLLAGSAQSLLWCVNQMAGKGLLSPEAAWNKASLKPMELLNGEPQIPFRKGLPANLVLFEQTEKGIEIVQTIRAGKVVFNQTKNEKDED
ncbi:N-acetylglucosamine-6-phosphate deacetylase [Prolixibacter bellariivorans]|uniref:N-acetylglucosamine-6-phosphate deacetylase n=1 Tax=Prolixibacter bellariivorans TaxID=314319 RepID=A0A5M4B572_9BACT|nr:amidohydrolase family protein [Prolixibacter bellariivorans]GET35041.1 N-acetylglucosamine-6-phosphate deacetylase [Prolixibacter bellariivorans]